MLIVERKIKLGKAPALLVFKESLDRAVEKGTILFYHGLGASKETNTKEYETLASRGFLTVAVDNAGHGERRHPDFDQLMSKDQFEKNYYQMVMDTVNETPLILDALSDLHLALPGRIGITGISMGGYITYGAILKEKRFSAAAPILGSPYFKMLNGKSPHSRADEFYPVAVLSQNGGKDESVPSHFARDFHERLKPFYKKNPEREKFIEYPHSAHFMNADDWDMLWRRTIEWFDRFLVPEVEEKKASVEDED